MFYRSQFTHLFALLLSALMLFSETLTRARGQQSSGPSQQSGHRSRRSNSSSQQRTPQPVAPLPQENEAPAREDVVQVETDLTNILFTAVDQQKRFLTTLRQEDIRVLEDNVKQQLFTFQHGNDLPLSLAIMIDVSSSQEQTLSDEKAAAKAFIYEVIREGKDQAAIISFTRWMTLEQRLTGNAADLPRAIDRVVMLNGATAIWDAIWDTADQVLTQVQTRRAIILLTDGIDTRSHRKMKEAIDGAVKAEVIIYAIGIGQHVEEETLRRVSEQTGGRAFFPRGAADLSLAFAQIQQELRSQYVIAYSSTNKMRDGSYRHVRIEVTNPELSKQKAHLTYRHGYFAKPFTPTSYRAP